jgi:Na+/alanine symporter
MKRLASIISILLVFTMLFGVTASAADIAGFALPESVSAGIGEGIESVKAGFPDLGQNPLSGAADNIKNSISQRIVDLLNSFLVKLEALYIKLGGTEADLREAEDIAVRLAALIETVASR